MTEDDLPAPLARLDTYADKYDQHVGPMTGFTAALGWVAAFQALVEWWGRWDEMTAIGKVGFVVATPLVVAAGLWALALAVALTAWAAVQVAIFAGGPKLVAWWRQVAYKGQAGGESDG